MDHSLLLDPLPLTALILSSLALLLWALLRPRSSGLKDEPPLVRSSPAFPFVPFIGPAIEFGKSPVLMAKRCYEDYGPVFTVPIANQRLTFLIGPEAQEPFCRATDEVLSQPEVYGFMKPVFGPNVVYDASRKDRMVQFQSMAHGLRTSRLRGYVSKIETETRAFLKDWGEEGTVDLLESLSDLTILTASRCLHGDDVRENLYREVSKLYHDLDQGVTPLSVFLPNAPTRAHANRDRARIKMVELFSGVIKERREDPSRGGDGTDILSIFMDVKYKDGRDITNEEVTGLLIALLFAGQHTSCITSTWTSLFIAKDRNIMRRVIEEQNSIFRDGDEGEGENGKQVNDDEPMDMDKVNKMELLHNCMREALRLCPPLILLMRKAMKDMPVEANGTKYTIPKGDTVMISPSVGMRLPSVFKDPDTFDPDRYSDPRNEHKASGPYAYLGFGGGMHSCMGQNFAFLQVKAILSVIFREYEVELAAEDGEMPNIDYEAMVVGPKGDCRVRYKRRKFKGKAAKKEE